MAIGLPSSAAHRERDLGEMCASSTCVGAQQSAVFAAICVPSHCVEADCCKYREPHHRASSTPACLFWIRVEPFDVMPEVTEEE